MLDILEYEGGRLVDGRDPRASHRVRLGSGRNGKRAGLGVVSAIQVSLANCLRSLAADRRTKQSFGIENISAYWHGLHTVPPRVWQWIGTMQFRHEEVSWRGLSWTVVDTVEAVMAPWRSLAARAPDQPFQHPAWIAAWLETRGRALSVRPRIAIGSHCGRCEMVVPLGVSGRGPCSVLRWLVGDASDYNAPLASQELRSGFMAAEASAFGVSSSALRARPLFSISPISRSGSADRQIRSSPSDWRGGVSRPQPAA